MQGSYTPSLSTFSLPPNLCDSQRLPLLALHGTANNLKVVCSARLPKHVDNNIQPDRLYEARVHAELESIIHKVA